MLVMLQTTNTYATNMFASHFGDKELEEKQLPLTQMIFAFVSEHK